MGYQVISGATLKCSMGMAPSSLVVLPVRTMADAGPPAANIGDHKPMINIMPFGLCRSLANPTVAAATSAAMGTLTPMPCIPNTPAPWMPGSPTFIVQGLPALNDQSTCACVYAGIVSVAVPGQVTTHIP